ncbi:MAG: YolD-like family protein [Lachnospiraceae bacterium]|nr:YolD-like family protein [Lachnospiraceae bacterium]
MSIYDDIISHPHHRSDKHPHMPMSSRAAQFSPFAALTGYDEMVDETQRLTYEKITLDTDAAEELDRRIQMIGQGKRAAAITYFLPDPFKGGGSYTIASGNIKKIDAAEEKIVMEDGTAIAVDDIFDISFLE